MSPDGNDSECKVAKSERTQLGGPRRPDITLGDFNERMTAMRSRLDALLPELARSNQELDPSQNMENLNSEDEDDQHIDMELACGVLEQKKLEDEDDEHPSIDGVRLPRTKDDQRNARVDGIAGLRKVQPPNSMENDELSSSDSDDTSSDDSSDASSDEGDTTATLEAPYHPKT